MTEQKEVSNEETRRHKKIIISKFVAIAKPAFEF